MTATLIRLLPDVEQTLLRCYVEGTKPPRDIAATYKELGVPLKAEAPPLEIAVARILLHHIQDRLPQWSSMDGDTLLENRKRHKRHKDARLEFNPKLVCTINWADSGPGFSWPEAYYITYLPGFNKFVVTSSRDGDDGWGCADHAIGVADGNVDPLDAAKSVITTFWGNQVDQWERERWVCIFDEGLADENTVWSWADEVWSQPDEELDEDREPTEEELEAAARKEAIGRETIATYREIIDQYVLRFSDILLRYPGSGYIGSKRVWATRFIEKYLVENGVLPDGEHQFHMFVNQKHDFTDLRSLGKSVEQTAALKVEP